MELCMKVQAVEYVIHAVGSSNFYTHLQFSLLASTWILGVCLWSAFHIFLVLYKALVLLVLFPIVFVLAVLMDANAVFLLTIGSIIFFLSLGIVVDTVWVWLVITWTMPGRAPGQDLGLYLFTAGGTLRQEDLQPGPVVEGGAAADGPCASLKEFCSSSVTLRFVNHVILVSFPYRRAQLGDLCREIVPWYDTIVI